MRPTPARHRWLLVGLLLVAALLRFAGSRSSPPGLSHDEVTNWLIVQDILAGRHAIYFTATYGHEAGFHYLQAATVALLGDHALALRLPAMAAGLLLVAVTYALNRRLFGHRVALLATALLAVLFWPVFFSRQGLRAISLPVISGLSASLWWEAWRRGRPRLWAVAGLIAGLSLHTYMAARAVPIFYILFFVYLLIIYKPRIRNLLPRMALFLVAMALVALPLALYLWRFPGAEFRISEIDAPLRALMAGDPRPVLRNVIAFLEMFAFRGDPLWRHNVAGMPVFDPATGGLFYAGLLVAIWRWRDARYAFALLWLLTGAIPSLVTIDAPSYIRIVNSLPVIVLFPALSIHRLGQLSTVFPGLSTDLARKRLGAILIVLLFAAQFARTADGIWRRWPANEEVRFVWQVALTEIAHFLDRWPAAGSVAVAGWTPETMDPPTMALSLRREDLRLAYFGPERTLIVPAIVRTSGLPHGHALIARPAILPLDPALEARLMAWGAPPLAAGSFVLYELAAPPAAAPAWPLEALFGGELRLLGVDLLPAGDDGNFISYWLVETPPDGPRRLFLHAVDDAGQILAQDDGLAAPAAYWRPGDLLLFRHRMPPLPGGVAGLRLGVYAPPAGPRLRLADGGEWVDLAGLAAQP